MQPRHGRRRVAIEDVSPQVEGGRFPAKRTVGDLVVVEADLLADGHDEIAAVLRYRHESERDWREVEMRPLGNDRWRASFPATELGTYGFAVAAWIDGFGSWRGVLAKKLDAGQDVETELEIGARLVARAATRAGPHSEPLRAVASLMRRGRPEAAVAAALDPELSRRMRAHADRRRTTQTSPLAILVERERARTGAWYELFPRSAAPEPGRHGTFADVIGHLPELAEMGFDVLYLAPIHPIGRVKRRGRNNDGLAGADDVGSPWAIGAEEGGHTAVHPDLGTLEDFGTLVDAARDLGLEIALDLAFQCAPDHPWVREHPEWFRRLPGGDIRHAENPPKRYEDIYPLDFDTPAWRDLWGALLDVVSFWADRGVRTFRVDNPHTKPFAFWEWMIAESRREHPDVVFLAEAFTRPKIMYRLAKLGFSQSYTYFAWRTTKDELTDYFTELTTPPVRDFFRASAWPNTPDILTETLQSGDPGAFAVRFVLAATLAASYGIYGPAFELCEHVPREPGSEEYRDSEKYEVRHWDLARTEPMRELIASVNRIRREHPALQRDDTLTFHRVDNPQLLAYTKRGDDGADVVLVVVNLDVRWRQSGWVDLDLDALGLAGDEPFDVRDLLSGARYVWKGPRNYVEVAPGLRPAHVFAIEAQSLAGRTGAEIESQDATVPAVVARQEPWEEAGS